MKNTSCDIIKDLMQNYIDNISSEATNELVENHIRTCKKCNEELKEMQKDVNIEPLLEQDEQIDYLKGFRKDKIRAIIKTILIFIIIILVLFLFFQQVEEKCEFFVDINTLRINYLSAEKLNENTIELEFQAIDTTYNLIFKNEETNGKDIYIEPVGKFTFFMSPSRTNIVFNINENTERVFLKDKKGNLKEIWNRSEGNLVQKIRY